MNGSNNIWRRFKELLPAGSRTVVSIIANNGNGTSQGRLRDGSTVTLKGEAVMTGGKAFVLNGEVKGTAPDLAQYDVEV